MNCASNIITANFSGGKTHATTARVYQWSRGIELCITGADDLPQTFKAHFSVQKRGGVATTIVGIDERVKVPNVLFTIGKDIHVWLGASETEDDAEILYTVDIPVAPAPMPEYYDAEDTGVFDAVVEQVADYAATATAAANSAGASATAAAGSASAAAASASSAAGSAGAAEQARADAVMAKGQAETAAQTATEKALQTAQNASQAASDAGRAESAAERAESAETGAGAAKTAAEAAAQSAAASAATADEKANLAGQSATAAAGSASAAAQSAASIEGDVQIASQKASEAQTAAGQAVTAKDAAVTAQQGAEAAATNAGQSASTATAKASEAATSASNAAQSKTDAEAAAARAEQAAATLTVDSALSDSSTNPVQNKVITAELTDVKSALTDITGNTAISGWVDGKFLSTYAATFNPSNPISNATFRYVIVTCTEGDKFTISGKGGGNPRLWAFADSLNNVLSRSTASEEATDLVLTAPENATQLILNDQLKTKNSYYGNIVRNRVSALETETAEIDATMSANTVSVDKRFQMVDGKMYLDPENFELGDIVITAIGWTYQNSTRRVRTKENYDLELEVGDVIRLKNYDAARMYIGFQITATTYGAVGWATEDYVCKYGGKYAILIDSVPSAVQSDKYALFDLLEIVKYDNYKQKDTILSSLTGSVISANHRGFSRSAPENTLPAFRLSKRYGFKYVETDVCWTSDGVPVLLHDGTINRTARNADGTEISETINIADITYAEALTYDFGIWKAAKYAGTRITTFVELATLCKKMGLKIFAEVKSYGYTSQRLTDLMDSAKAIGVFEDIIWLSFENSILQRIVTVDASAAVELLSTSITADIIASANALKTGTNRVYVASSSYTETEVNLCKTSGIPLVVYTINDADAMNALPIYVSGVTSDLFAVNVVWLESEN